MQLVRNGPSLRGKLSKSWSKRPMMPISSN